MFVENEKPTQGMEPKGGKNILETGGIDPPTSHMLSERSTI